MKVTKISLGSLLSFMVIPFHVDGMELVDDVKADLPPSAVISIEARPQPRPPLNFSNFAQTLTGQEIKWTEEDERKLVENKSFRADVTTIVSRWPKVAQETCILGACYYCQPHILDLLLNTLKVSFEDGSTSALFAALEMGYKQPGCARVTKLLIDHGVNVNSFEALDQEGKIQITPLFAAANKAARTGIMEPLYVLLQSGADPEKAAYYLGRTVSISHIFHQAPKAVPDKFQYIEKVLKAVTKHRSATNK